MDLRSEQISGPEGGGGGVLENVWTKTLEHDILWNSVVWLDNILGC